MTPFRERVVDDRQSKPLMGRPQTEATRAKIGALCKQRWDAGAYADRKKTPVWNKVTWTEDMTAEFVRLFWLGRDLDVIAHAIGVSRPLLAREKKRLGLPSRRHIKGFYKRTLPRHETKYRWT